MAQALKIIIVVLLIFFMLNLVVGFYYLDYSDIFFYFIMSGNISKFPEPIFSSLGSLFLISDVISVLYFWVTKINWYAIFLLLVNFISSIFLLRYFYFLFLRFNIKGTILFSTLIFLIFSFQNLIYLHYTISAFSLSISSILLLVFIYDKPNNFYSYSKFIIITACLIIASFIRVEAIIFVLLFTIVTLYLQPYINCRKFKFSVLFFVLFISLISFVFKEKPIWHQSLVNNDMKFYNDFEGYIFDIWDIDSDHKNYNDLSQRDEIKLDLFKEYFMGDMDSISISFFKNLGIGHTNSLFSINENSMNEPWVRIKRALGLITNIFLDNPTNYIPYFLILSLVSYLTHLYKQTSDVKYKIMLHFIVLLSFIFIIAVINKAAHKVMYPASQMGLLFTTTFLFKFKGDVKFKHNERFIFSLIILLLLATFLISNVNRANNARNYFKLNLESSKFLLEIEDKIPKDKILLFDMFSSIIFQNKISILETQNFNKYFAVDFPYLTFYSSYKNKFKALFMGSDFKDFVLYLKCNNNNIVYLTTEKRLLDFTNYMNVIYNCNFSFHELDNIDSSVNISFKTGNDSDVVKAYAIYEQ